VPITSNDVILISGHDDVYSIQRFVMKFVSDFQLIDRFLWKIQFPPPINLTHDMTEILLTVIVCTNDIIPVIFNLSSINKRRGHYGRDRMVVGFTTTYAISAYHHLHQ